MVSFYLIALDVYSQLFYLTRDTGRFVSLSSCGLASALVTLRVKSKPKQQISSNPERPKCFYNPSHVNADPNNRNNIPTQHTDPSRYASDP